MVTPDDDEELSADAVVELPFEDVLDLHGFPPRDVREIVQGYLDDAEAAGFSSVRIVHGRGMGVQRRTGDRVHRCAGEPGGSRGDSGPAASLRRLVARQR